MSKELLFSVTEKDFEFTYSRGSGKGGQKRNKTSSQVHCKHIESGALAYSDATRSQHNNKIDAFKKCIDTRKFKNWLNLRIAKASGQLEDIEKFVNSQMTKTKIKVETRHNGVWVEDD